eukprot:1790183-Rhodomonas_salina.1
MNQSDATLRGIKGARAPLYTKQPRITFAEGAMQSPFPGIPNSIFVEFRYDVNLPSDAEIM